MPAAAVIPAPIAYIKVVAVKKLVVGFRGGLAGPSLRLITEPKTINLNLEMIHIWNVKRIINN